MSKPLILLFFFSYEFLAILFDLDPANLQPFKRETSWQSAPDLVDAAEVAPLLRVRVRVRCKAS